MKDFGDGPAARNCRSWSSAVVAVPVDEVDIDCNLFCLWKVLDFFFAAGGGGQLGRIFDIHQNNDAVVAPGYRDTGKLDHR